MNEYILETKKLTKQYKNKKIINNLNLKIKKGEIYGLLGKNGAGKTTLMCMITQLVKKDSGNIYFNGKNILSDKNIYDNIGCLIEYPGFYDNLTGYENLQYFQEIQTNADKKELISILETVNLVNDKDKLVKDYSMGMKQRLAIATAIINKPELLILDEPINGLDPKGIIDMRNFLNKLSDEYSMTILISSHILSEIEQIADRIGILSNGNLIEEIKVKNLKEKLYKHTEIKVDDILTARDVISGKFNMNVSIADSKIIITDKKIISNVIRELLNNDICVYSVIPVIENLEEYFIRKIEYSEMMCNA